MVKRKPPPQGYLAWIAIMVHVFWTIHDSNSYSDTSICQRQIAIPLWQASSGHKNISNGFWQALDSKYEELQKEFGKDCSALAWKQYTLAQSLRTIACMSNS